MSYDPNFRPLLMGTPEEILPGVHELLGVADVVKVSEEDLGWLHPGREPGDVVGEWLELGPAVVVVTLGANGVLAGTSSGLHLVLPGRTVEVVDTVGAGDSFSAALLAGLPFGVSGQTVNRLCGSSMTALHAATNAIKGGMGEVYMIGGVEHMGHVPMDYNFDGNPELSLRVSKASAAMGMTAEMLTQTHQVGRSEQDEFALNSHKKAQKAYTDGAFREEMMPIHGHDADGMAIKVDFDEVVRADANIDDLGKLRPVFNPKGSVTAGNSSAISDGACALLVMSADRAKALGLKPLAKVRAMASSGCNPSIMGIGPVPASKKALQRAGLSLDDIDYFELNEAFAAQSLAVIKEL